MSEEGFQERTEEASQRKREEARKKGQVAKSRELASVAVLLAGLLTLFWGADFFYRQFHDLLVFYFENLAAISISLENVDWLVLLSLKQMAFLVGPFFFVLVVVAFFANFLQTGPLFSLEAISFKLSKLDPFAGFGRIFSLVSLVELVKGIAKVLIVGSVAFYTINQEIGHLLPLLSQSPHQILSYMGGVSFNIFWRSCLAMIVLAVLDYMFQRWEFERNLRMTKQELKEEYKQTEGDPMVKARVRSLQREMARKRMMAEVPKADVVITNPTHYAVALKYEAGKMSAPMVIAKGTDNVALRIREIAKEAMVPVVENPPLAQSLYKLVEIGKAIPTELYEAVAEVLAYVYKLKKKR